MFKEGRQDKLSNCSSQQRIFKSRSKKCVNVLKEILTSKRVKEFTSPSRCSKERSFKDILNTELHTRNIPSPSQASAKGSICDVDSRSRAGSKRGSSGLLMESKLQSQNIPNGYHFTSKIYHNKSSKKQRSGIENHPKFTYKIEEGSLNLKLKRASFFSDKTQNLVKKKRGQNSINSNIWGIRGSLKNAIDIIDSSMKDDAPELLYY